MGHALSSDSATAITVRPVRRFAPRVDAVTGDQHAEYPRVVPLPGLIHRGRQATHSTPAAGADGGARDIIAILRRRHPESLDQRNIESPGRLTTGKSAEPAIIRRMPVKQAVPANAVVSASGSPGNAIWMIVHGLEEMGLAQWHMTILPINQHTWKKPYALPADGKRGLTDWMEFDEFHITGPGSKHFYYTEHLVPLAVSQSGGKSRPWNDADWESANRIVAWKFRQQDYQFAYEWLSTYVRERPAQERTEAQYRRAAEAHQNNVWRLYNNLAKANGTADLPDFQVWAQQTESAFQGTKAEFWEYIAGQVKQST